MQTLEHSFKAMGGPCRLRIECDDHTRAAAAVRGAEEEVRRLESKYSRYLPDSLTSEINRGAGSGRPVTIDTETAGLLNYADTLWRQSDGLFDLTSGVLRKAWDFRSGRLPEPARLARYVSLVGWQSVEWSATQVSLPLPDMELDFGGCVKEYACDSVAAKLRNCGVAHGLVDLGGDMAAVGPRADGSPWRVGIRRPGQRDEALARIDIPAGGLASSGDYERCLEIDGKRYGHILNPKTGWPVQGLVAVSVLAPQCLVAGSGATIAMLKPEREGLDWLEQLGLPWLAVDAGLGCHGSISG